jgi:hypothetical protein
MPAKFYPIGAIILPWGRNLGVAFSYGDGQYDARAIESDDWPVLARLDRDGCLTFTNERMHELYLRGGRDGLLPSR